MAKYKIKTKLIKGIWKALDWVYPPVCAVCGMPGHPLCSDCKNKIHFVSGKVCSICGASINHYAALCTACKSQKPVIDGVRSLALYGGVIRECIHSLKYENNRAFGKYFAELLHPIIIREAWSIDAVIPVPLSKERLRERGYNQAAAVAHPLGVFLDVPYQPFGLEQVRDTRSQVGLSAEERRMNVVNAFKANMALVSEKNILLVDDVMTTGATIESCAKALKDANSGKVFCATIARFFR